MVDTDKPEDHGPFIVLLGESIKLEKEADGKVRDILEILYPCHPQDVYKVDPDLYKAEVVTDNKENCSNIILITAPSLDGPLRNDLEGTYVGPQEKNEAHHVQLGTVLESLVNAVKKPELKRDKKQYVLNLGNEMVDNSTMTDSTKDKTIPFKMIYSQNPIVSSTPLDAIITMLQQHHSDDDEFCKYLQAVASQSYVCWRIALEDPEDRDTKDRKKQSNSLAATSSQFAGLNLGV